MLRQTISYFPPQRFGPHEHVKHRPNNRIVIEKAGIDCDDMAVLKFEFERGSTAAYSAESSAAYIGKPGSDVFRCQTTLTPIGNVVIKLDEFRSFNETEFFRTSDGNRSERGSGFLAAVGAVTVPHEHQLFDFESDATAEATSPYHV